MYDLPYPVHYEQYANVTVYHVPFEVNEAVVPNAEDDGYSIYLNDRLTDEEARNAFEHAMRHIHNCDFDKADVQEIEAKAHGDQKFNF